MEKEKLFDIQRLISNGGLDAALEKLQQIDFNSVLITQLSARYNCLCQQVAEGVLKDEDERQERNKITSAVLKLIKKMMKNLDERANKDGGLGTNTKAEQKRQDRTIHKIGNRSTNKTMNNNYRLQIQEGNLHDFLLDKKDILVQFCQVKTNWTWQSRNDFLDAADSVFEVQKALDNLLTYLKQDPNTHVFQHTQTALRQADSVAKELSKYLSPKGASTISLKSKLDGLVKSIYEINAWLKKKLQIGSKLGSEKSDLA